MKLKSALWRSSKKKKMRLLKRKSNPSRQIKKRNSVMSKCSSKSVDPLRLTALDLRTWKPGTKQWWNCSLIPNTESSSEFNKTMYSTNRSWNNWWYRDSSSSMVKILSSSDVSNEIYLLAKLSLVKLSRNTKIYWNKRWTRKLN